MINLVFRSLILLTVLYVMVISGCVEADIADDAPSWPDVASLEAPTWSTGDYWNYVDDYGGWMNLTVEAVEERNGYTTYRVFDVSEGHRTGDSRTTQWVDTQTLGIVAFWVNDGYQCRFDPPRDQKFPMINRTYTHSVNCPKYNTTGNIEHRVRGWSEISTSAGTFQAIELHSYDKNTEQTSITWFAPHVGNIIGGKENGQMYRLASWSYAASPG